MGRNTWESLPSRPLPRRTNCVISRDSSVADHVFQNVDDAIDFCHGAGHQRLYGIGGQSIYEALLPRADRLLITEVSVDVPDADTWFPTFDESMWRENRRTVIRQESPRCTVRELLRVRDSGD
ncbi:dihydrofolate reductase [Allgaiera indica]|nr:dihydrofolate reductase [Allgaiera indica]